jgi:hypothetical protein
VEAKQSAEEDIALARNQRQQQTTQAGTKLATAQTEAQVYTRCHMPWIS